MCTVLLPRGVNPTEVKKYINIYIYYIIAPKLRFLLTIMRLSIPFWVLLGAFAKLRRATITFMSVRPSVRME